MPLYAHRHAHAHTCAHKTYFLNFSSGNKTVLTCATQCLIPWLKPASDSLTGTHLHCCVAERPPQMKGHKHQKGKRESCDAFTSPCFQCVKSPSKEVHWFSEFNHDTSLLPDCLLFWSRTPGQFLPFHWCLNGSHISLAVFTPRGFTAFQSNDTHLHLLPVLWIDS